MSHPRIFQALILIASLVIFIYATLSAADFAMFVGADGALPQRCALKFPRWLGCVVANHENLAGGLFGAAGTIFAGWIAWLAVERQIVSSARMQGLLQQETFEAISADLRDLMENLNEIWRTIDFARTGPEAEVLDRRVIAGVACSSLNAMLFDGLELLGKDLTPLRRRSFSNVLAQLRAVGDVVQEIAKGNGHEANAGRLITIAWIQLSHLEKYLQSFNPELARIFAARQKSAVVHENAAFHIRPFVNEHVRD